MEAARGPVITAASQVEVCGLPTQVPAALCACESRATHMCLFRIPGVRGLGCLPTTFWEVR